MLTEYLEQLKDCVDELVGMSGFREYVMVGEEEEDQGGGLGLHMNNRKDENSPLIAD